MRPIQENLDNEVLPVPSAVPRSSPTGNALATYRKEEYSHLSPVQIIYKLFDVALRACKSNDRDLSRKAINELIVGLNFEHKDIALNLYGLYDYSKRCIQAGKMAQAIEVLEELRSAWGQAFKLQAQSNV